MTAPAPSGSANSGSASSGFASSGSSASHSAASGPITLAQVRQAPKVLLHDHLDGGLRPSTILELADECGWTSRLPSRDPNDLHAYFIRGAESRDILAYLATFEHTVALMQSQSAIARIASEAALDLAADGVVYAEVRFAPELHVAGGLPLEAIVEAVQSGFRSGEAAARGAGQQIEINTIICAMRTEQRSTEISELAIRMRAKDPRIVGFDLAGAETGWPPSLHAEALTLARNELMRITIHASEPPDLELIHDALVHGAERIGHGVRLAADVDPTTGELGPLARYVRDRQITLEMAPTCNVQIGAVPTLADHPIGRFLRAGLRVGVNTDNRLMSNVSMGSEVHAVATTFSLTWAEIGQLARNAMEGSFADADTKRRLLNTVINPAYQELPTVR